MFSVVFSTIRLDRLPHSEFRTRFWNTHIAAIIYLWMLLVKWSSSWQKSDRVHWSDIHQILMGTFKKKSNIISEICVCCSSVLKYIISRIPSNAPVWIIYCMTCVRSSNFWGWQILMPYNTEQLSICMFSSYNAGISNTSKCRFETHKVKDSL